MNEEQTYWKHKYGSVLMPARLEASWYSFGELRHALTVVWKGRFKTQTIEDVVLQESWRPATESEFTSQLDNGTARAI